METPVECEDSLEDVDCPVCGLKVKGNDINAHLDHCLKPAAAKKLCLSSQDGERNTLEKSAASTKRASWGSLMSPAALKRKIAGGNHSENSPKPQNNIRGKDVTSTPPTQTSSQTRPQERSVPKDKPFAPLAEQMRPDSLEDYEGQQHVLSNGSMLRSLVEARRIPSMIFWGPPGCGKTTLAHIIAQMSKKKGDTRFVTISATTAGVKDVKEVVDVARTEQRLLGRKTVLFIDEIHRFNKLQQDVFLPHVESGVIILLGATTENPSFTLNSALLSRCRVVVLEKLPSENILRILERALGRLGVQLVGDVPSSSSLPLTIESGALQILADVCDGDARTALNGLQLAVQSAQNSPHENGCSPATITVDHIREGLQRTHLLYDRGGEQHYDTISAFIKSMRGSDDNAALYWLARMLEGGEDPRFVARRLVIFASEDVGLADSGALHLAVSTMQSCQLVGMPEARIMLAHCTVYMARAPKSRETYDAYEKAAACVQDHRGVLPPVPLHLRNAPTRLMKELGYGRGYRMYNTDGQALPFMPEGLHKESFFS